MNHHYYCNDLEQTQDFPQFLCPRSSRAKAYSGPTSLKHSTGPLWLPEDKTLKSVVYSRIYKKSPAALRA